MLVMVYPLNVLFLADDLFLSIRLQFTPFCQKCCQKYSCIHKRKICCKNLNICQNLPLLNLIWVEYVASFSKRYFVRNMGINFFQGNLVNISKEKTQTRNPCFTNIVNPLRQNFHLDKKHNAAIFKCPMGCILLQF